jgi:tRNA(Arg) A34 adenosine deaminase TadA
MVVRYNTKMENDTGFQAALEEARQGAAQGGVPIGACLVSAEGKILGRGHNMRIQKGSATIHVRVYHFACVTPRLDRCLTSNYF